MAYTAVDVHGFGGGFTLGAVQAGFDLIGKMSASAGFGVNNTLANRQLLGDNWDSITSSETRKWPEYRTDVVFGNPPCSGFSTLSNPAFRGLDSPINDMMWEVMEYAIRARPQIVIFESVQQTFRQGLPLMRELFEFVRDSTGLPYKLYHVLHNNASVGGMSNRKRYFWVASQVPFGVESNRVRRNGDFADVTEIPTFSSALRDLEPLGLTMEEQPYDSVEHIVNYEGEVVRTFVANGSSWAAEEMHDGTGFVDGHDILRSPGLYRSLELINGTGIEWLPGENLAKVMRKYHDKYDRLTPLWDYMTRDGVPKSKKVLDNRDDNGDFRMGHNQMTRWHWDRPANVITGGGAHLVMHPTLERTLTQRELARIQGFPDDWKILPLRGTADLGPSWGKGVPVTAGRWIARWARESLDGRPGELSGGTVEAYDKRVAKKFGEMPDEFVIDITNDWKTKPLVVEPSML